MIALDNTSSSAAGAGTASSATISHVIGSTANTNLYVCVAWFNAATISSVKYGGVTMTAVGSAIANGSQKIQWYYLSSPTSGTANVVVTMSVASYIWVTNISLSGVLAAAPEALQSATGTSRNVTANITTITANDWVLDCEQNASFSPAANSGQTTILNAAHSAGSGTYVSSGYVGPLAAIGVRNGSYTLGNTGAWSYQLIAVQPASNPTNPTGQFFAFMNG